MRINSLAVIGCGAIAESYYFPILSADSDLRSKVWLVDPSGARRDALAKQHGFPVNQCVADIEQLPAGLSAAINATPSHLHVKTTVPLLERGISVVVEKPLAENAQDARALVILAKDKDCRLTVNQFRRLTPSYSLVKSYISGGKLGDIVSLNWTEGHRFDWPTQSGFNFRRPWVGRARGSLLDIGVHVLDAIHWWLEGKAFTVKHATLDGYGGPEAFVRAAMQAGSAQVAISISFLEKLQNSFLIEGTKGSIRGRTNDFETIEFKAPNGGWRTINAPGSAKRNDIAARFIGNFIAAVEGNEPLLIDGDSAAASLKTIDAIYETAADDLPNYYKEWVA